MKKIIFLLFFSLLLISSPIQATPVYYGLISTVSGSDMAGMEISVTFEGNSSDTQTWESLTGDEGGASGTDWELTYTGSNTWPSTSTSWTLESTEKITSLVIDAATGGIFFDIFSGFINNPDYIPSDDANYDPSIPYIISSNYPDTDGSYSGWWQGLEFQDPSANISSTPDKTFEGDTTDYSWIFSDPVNLDGSDAQGDLFGKLTINFKSSVTNFSFLADTDMAAVPEPSTLLLVAFGFLGAAGIGRKTVIKRTIP